MAKARLTQIGVQRLKDVGMHPDGLGLYLDVKPSGTKSWVLRYMLSGRSRYMGLGPYPAISLAEAREKAAAYRATIKSGIDPLEVKQQAKADSKLAKRITFEEAAKKYIESHRSAWKNDKHLYQWKRTLEVYAESISALDVSLIEVAHIVALLQKDDLWTAKTETATRLRGRIEKVLDWCSVHGYRGDSNPARWRGRLEALLPAPGKVQRITHLAALPYEQMPDFMPKLQAMAGTSARALELAILTAARSGEVRGARWEEISIDDGLWVIPAERMKASKEHRVSLSAAAIDVLQSMIPQESGLIFQGKSKKGEPQPLSDMSLTAVLRRMGLKETVHGFRSSFRDWGAEQTDYANEVLEMALAHAVGNKVEAAYRRGDLLEKRKDLMTDWAKFCGVAK